MKRNNYESKSYEELKGIMKERYGSMVALTIACICSNEELFDEAMQNLLDKHDQTMDKLFKNGTSFDVINRRIESFQDLFDLIMAMHKALKNE